MALLRKFALFMAISAIIASVHADTSPVTDEKPAESRGVIAIKSGDKDEKLETAAGLALGYAGYGYPLGYAHSYNYAKYPVISQAFPAYSAHHYAYPTYGHAYGYGAYGHGHHAYGHGHHLYGHHGAYGHHFGHHY